MRKTLVIALAAAASMALTACNKTEEAAPPAETAAPVEEAAPAADAMATDAPAADAMAPAEDAAPAGTEGSSGAIKTSEDK